MGYFQLALAAALEDQANPQAIYVVYMKLAEIHGSHIPNTDLCQVYRDRAHSLKRVLAGEDAVVAAAACGEDENVEHFGCTDIKLTSVPDTIKSQAPSLSTSEPHGDSNTFNGDAEKDANRKPSQTQATSTSRSHSDSTFTESFDTAREHISDSSSSTDTLQTDRRVAQEGEKDLDADIVHIEGSLGRSSMNDSIIQASTKL